MITWTPPELASNARRYGRACWRVVEAQHAVATMRLVDTLAEQAMLEQVLEASKPSPPPIGKDYHYLLATPFRYRPRTGSRFRAPHAAGVWYGAEAPRTALAEKSYWRQRFLLDSPSMPELGPVAHTLFSVDCQTSRALDLVRAPLSRDEARWMQSSDYGDTQELAARARQAQPPLQLIRYRSVRDHAGGFCIAVLDPSAFKSRAPTHQETWFIAASRQGARCVRDSGLGTATAFEFHQA